jgi:hypothetical protein
LIALCCGASNNICSRSTHIACLLTECCVWRGTLMAYHALPPLNDYLVTLTGHAVSETP